MLMAMGAAMAERWVGSLTKLLQRTVEVVFLHLARGVRALHERDRCFRGHPEGR